MKKTYIHPSLELEELHVEDIMNASDDPAGSITPSEDDGSGGFGRLFGF